ncbi:hypothetical protein CL622_07505 [archaeon]|nr:hypothetical protein [archaeon]|tara:strand:- start:304 stop:570 length:267 start_codon:yes stop_codon:yes gene_type:complete
MANIWIEEHGVFTVSNDKVQELLTWLANNQAVQAEGTSPDFGGQSLLNEQGTEQPPPPKPQKQSNTIQGNTSRKVDPNKTWDMGTKWI